MFDGTKEPGAGRTIQSHQRNPNRSLQARKAQNWPPRNETLERLQLKEILQVTQNPNLNHDCQASGWEANDPTLQLSQRETKLQKGLIPRRGYVGSSTPSAAQTTEQTFVTFLLLLRILNP